MKTLVCVLFAALTLSAADVDVTGKWSGTAVMTRSGESRDSGAFLILKQSGAEITGSVGPEEAEQHPISKGKIEGDKITLELQTDNGLLVKFDLVVAADKITGEANATQEGQTMKMNIDVTRAK